MISKVLVCLSILRTAFKEGRNFVLNVSRTLFDVLEECIIFVEKQKNLKKYV